MENQNYTEEIDLQKYLLVLKRRWLVAAGVFAACTGLAGFTLLTLDSTFEASGKLLFQDDSTSELTKFGEKIGHLESVKRESNPLDTQALLVKSELVKKKVVENLDLKGPDGGPLNPDFLSIKAKPVVGTDVINVAFVSENPEMAKKIVNQVMKSYINKNIKSNRSKATAAGGFVEQQLPRTVAELEKAAEDLRQFKLQNNIIELKRETSAAVDTLTRIEEDLSKAQSQFADISAQETQIRNQMNLPEELAVDITSLSQAPGVQKLLTQLQEVQSKLVTQSSLYTSQHPSIVNLQSDEAGLKALLNQRITESLGYSKSIPLGKLQMGGIKQGLAEDFVELQSQRLGLQQKIQTLSQLKADYKNRSDNLPNLEKRQGQLERRLLVAQESYENLLSRLQEIKVAESQTVGNASVLEPAKSYPSPGATKKKLGITVGGTFAGVLFGVAAAFFVDLIDRRVKTAKEAESLFGYTLLGLIPKFGSNNISVAQSIISNEVSERVIVATTPRTVIHEAYQMLQANLKFISLDRKVRSIVVTSSISGEGKTEVAANLAAVMAQVGRRVLLVDADMRKPSQHHLWGLINSVGLSNVMVGDNDFEEAVKRITENLSVLTAGVMPPNPLALIDSEKMTTFIDMLSQKYDLIVFDTPPLMGTADSAVLSQMADGALVVVRPGLVNSNSATAAKSLLARSEANVLGIVANGVNIKYEPKNYFYYDESRSESGANKPENVVSS
ncbi:MAG: polysaccharide biosynthesis tyrosine autokinase [Cyanobacteria bacterium P01_H01_bin.150]